LTIFEKNRPGCKGSTEANTVAYSFSAQWAGKQSLIAVASGCNSNINLSIVFVVRWSQSVDVGCTNVCGEI